MAAAAFGQDLPIGFPVPAFPQPLKEYLGLSDTQVAAISKINADFNQFAGEKQRRALQVQQEIAAETAKETIDPMALGVRYLELEAIRRELRDHQATLLQGTVAGLNDAQKAKLKVLDDAWKLQAVISEAQCENLLAGATVNSVTPGIRIGDFSGSLGSILLGGFVSYPACGAVTVPLPQTPTP